MIRLIEGKQEAGRLLDKIRPKKIMVAGDIMLDEYYKGTVKRISPEAPVPVFLKEKSTCRPGGAANVAVNLAVNKMEVFVLSVIGKDKNGAELKRMFEEAGISTECLVASDRPTCTKIRLLAANNQQVLRMDKEDTSCIDAAAEKQLVQIFRSKIQGMDAVILSDYMKGMLTQDLVKELVAAASDTGVKILADVKDPKAGKYKGAYLVKPNRNELSLLTGMQTGSMGQMKKAMGKLLEVCGSEYVLTTLGAEGMILADRTGHFKHLKAAAHEVFDVTGAGDTVIAFLGMCVANGLAVEEAMELANDAAGIQVSKAGTSAVTLEEIKDAADADLRQISGYEKRIDRAELKLLREKYMDKKIVFTNGCFDILHVGHVRCLRQAALLGDILVVGVNSDDSVRRIKGSDRPVSGEDDRAEMLAAYEFVDYVTVFDEDTPYEAIQALRPDVLVKGGDYNPDDVAGKDIVEADDGRVEIIPYTDGKSTTNIIEKIKGSTGTK